MPKGKAEICSLISSFTVPQELPVAVICGPTLRSGAKLVMDAAGCFPVKNDQNIIQHNTGFTLMQASETSIQAV